MNNDNLIPLSTFVTVAELRSFRLAAERLNVTPPAVSTRICHLERKIGLRLLNRTTRSVSLTAEGERLFLRATSILTDIDEIFRELRDQSMLKSGRVTLASVETFTTTFLPHLLSEFHRQQPGVCVVVCDLRADAAIEAVRMGKADLGLVSEYFPHKQLDFEPIWHDRFVAIVPPRHALAQRKSINIVELADQNLLLPPAETGMRQFIDAIFAKFGIRVQASHELLNVSAFISMVAAGHGVAIVPASCTQRGEAQACRVLPLKGLVGGRALGIATATERLLSPAADAFRQFAKAQLRCQDIYCNGGASSDCLDTRSAPGNCEPAGPPGFAGANSAG